MGINIDNINIVKRKITADEFIEMRKIIGWNCPDKETVSKGLNNTLFMVCAEHGNELVGCGRIIGDGAFTIHIQDIMIKPEYQRCGIGTAILTEIMTYIKETYGKGTMVCVMAAKGKENFYKKFNFIERPNEYYGAGMVQFIE